MEVLIYTKVRGVSETRSVPLTTGTSYVLDKGIPKICTRRENNLTQGSRVPSEGIR